MSDLVKRLHAMANVPEVDFDPVVINEAADRIKALEAALREIAMLFDSDDGSLEDAIIIASRAIAKRQDK